MDYLASWRRRASAWLLDAIGFNVPIIVFVTAATSAPVRASGTGTARAIAAVCLTAFEAR